MDYSRGRTRVIEGGVGDWESGHGERYELITCQRGYCPEAHPEHVNA